MPNSNKSPMKVCQDLNEFVMNYHTSDGTIVVFHRNTRNLQILEYRPRNLEEREDISGVREWIDEDSNEEEDMDMNTWFTDSENGV